MRIHLSRNLLALLLILLGIILVLDNIGVLNTDFQQLWHYLYPSLIIILGIHLFYRFLKKGGEGWIFGSFFIIFGSLLLLGKFDIIDYTFRDLFKLWPLLIMYVGFSMIGKANRRRRPRIHITTDNDDKGFHEHIHVGTVEYQQANWKVKPMDLRNIAGDFYLDFTKAFIPEEEIPITIRSWAGDVHLLLPEDVACRIDAYVKVGEVTVMDQTADGINRSLHYESPDYEEAVRKLDIHINVKAGSIRVNRV